MAYTYTFAEAISAVYSRMRETDSAILPKTNVKFWINEGHRTFLKEKHFQNLDASINFNTSIDTSVTTAITPASITIVTADASGLPTTGATLQINGDVIAYTGITTNTLTGVTNIGSDHVSGEKIQRIYNISIDLSVTDLDKPTYLSLDDVEIEYYDGRGELDDEKYTIIGGYLFLPYCAIEKRCYFKYKKFLAALVNDSDVFSIPDDYIGAVIEYGLYKAKLDLGMPDYTIHYGEYMRFKKLFFKDTDKQTDIYGRRIRSIYQPNFF